MLSSKAPPTALGKLFADARTCRSLLPTPWGKSQIVKANPAVGPDAIARQTAPHDLDLTMAATGGLRAAAAALELAGVD